MGLNFHTIQVLLVTVGGVFGIALELILLHTLVWARQWFELRVQAETMRTYTEIVRASVDYAEEWAHQEHAARHKIYSEDKLHKAALYATSNNTVQDSVTLRLAIHSELGRRRGLRMSALISKMPPPLPKV